MVKLDKICYLYAKIQLVPQNVPLSANAPGLIVGFRREDWAGAAGNELHQSSLLREPISAPDFVLNVLNLSCLEDTA